MIFSKKLLSYFLITLSLQAVLLADCAESSCQNTSQNFWMPRAFNSYRTREMLMLQDHQSRKNILSFSSEYMQNFGCKSDRLGALPFWSGSNTMTIGTNDGKSDLDAYQFGLGEVIKEGTITLTPKIKHIGGEMLWRVAHSECDTGPFFQVKVPLGAMMIESKVTEDVALVSSTEDADWSKYPAQRMRFDSITEALTGASDREPDLKYGRLCPDRSSVVRCGDIETVVGYNFYSSNKGYFTAGFKLSAPTGNIPQAKFLLEPVFGRAGHWGVGTELAGSYKVHESSNMDVYLSMRGDLLHLTSGRKPHWRSFDLALNGQGSKYLLLQKYETVYAGNPAAYSSQPGAILPAINITTMPVLSTVSVEGSFAMAVQVQKEHWNMSLMGEFWGRSHECLKLDCAQIIKSKDENLNDYAVLGRQISTKDLNSAGANKWLCEPAAKINQSKSRQSVPSSTPTANVNSFPNNVKDARVSTNRIPADPAVALDIAGAQAPQALTGKVTAEIGYTWNESSLSPHFALFGGVEFANTQSRFENLWSVGVQGSMIF